MASRFLENIPAEFIEVMTPAGDSYVEEPRHQAEGRPLARPRRGRGRDRRPAEPPKSSDDSDYGEEKVVRIGTRVRHPDWGPGSVRGCEGYGAQLRLTVRFDSGIIKRILATYANLEMLDDDYA
jgi:hypothetical protein